MFELFFVSAHYHLLFELFKRTNARRTVLHCSQADNTFQFDCLSGVHNTSSRSFKKKLQTLQVRLRLEMNV